MAEDGKGLTPEKQLLNLIEDPKAGSGKKQVVKRKGRLVFSLAGFKGRVSFFRKKKKLAAKKSKKTALDLWLVNRVLMLVLVLAGVYLGRSIFKEVEELQNMPTFDMDATQQAQGMTESSIGASLKTVVYYLERIRQRDLFNPSAIHEETVEEEPEAEEDPFDLPELAPKVDEKTASLELVGISWSSDPDVMIEDTSAQRTYFLKLGAEFFDGVKVEAIFKDYVILSYEGQEVELR